MFDWMRCHCSQDIEDGYCLLDPIKVGIVSPGMNDDGSLDESGIPGPLVNAYLESYGTVAARTTDFMVLVMFSIGVTKGIIGWALEAVLSTLSI
jgi:arginine/lysine/ornithine decarboxylase